MSRLDLIRAIGDVITQVDLLRSQHPRDAQERRRLDDLRDELDTSQRRLVRSAIQDNTREFRERTASLQEAQAALVQTIADVNRTAETLAALTRFVEVVQKVLALAP